jgi:Sugar (and other) transporter
LDIGKAELYFPSYILRFFFGSFLCLFAFSFAFSVGLISWVLPAEVFPLRARAKVRLLIQS